MAKIRRFTESQNTNRLEDFYEEYQKLFNTDGFEEGEEYTNHELFTEVGQLVNKYNLSKEDVGVILKNYDNGFDINRFLQGTYDEWDKYNDNKEPIREELIEIMRENDISKSELIEILKDMK